ncbi:failed axon connections-like [Branchiostoma floridae]|uniref:Failed axon connections-like n=1 Tax=Branchiostoma floridae TaxID=7739 RepID=A0A9J7NBX8_BRAFL|nr:failed axon connections-like [Branchiostoma floridae]XP_035698014.1 failed axon connections-like [Branchiostoma floridae]
MGWPDLNLSSSTQVTLCVATGCGVVMAGLLTLRQLKKWRMKGKKTERRKDVVYLHGFQRMKFTPSLSGPCLKVETWLRMAGVKYEFVDASKSGQRSKYGQLPFVELNGTEIADSNIIIQRLARQFNADLDADLSPEQQAVALTISRMVEEHTKWTMYQYYFVDRLDLFTQLVGLPGPRIIHWLIRNRVSKMMQTKLYHQGVGRHSKTEVYQLGNADIRALSALLGDKPFLMGTKPTTVDASVFGQLAQVVYTQLPSPHRQVIINSCDNLLDYCDRIKDQFYPDWELLCAEGH